MSASVECDAHYSDAKSITWPFSDELFKPVSMVKLKPLLPLYYKKKESMKSDDCDHCRTR